MKSNGKGALALKAIWTGPTNKWPDIKVCSNVAENALQVQAPWADETLKFIFPGACLDKSKKYRFMRLKGQESEIHCDLVLLGAINRLLFILLAQI